MFERIFPASIKEKYFETPKSALKTIMGKAAEYMSRTKIGAYFHETRESRKLVLVIVAIALLLDNMLLTTVGKLFVIILSFSEEKCST